MLKWGFHYFGFVIDRDHDAGIFVETGGRDYDVPRPFFPFIRCRRSIVDHIFDSAKITR